MRGKFILCENSSVNGKHGIVQSLKITHPDQYKILCEEVAEILKVKGVRMIEWKIHFSNKFYYSANSWGKKV